MAKVAPDGMIDAALNYVGSGDTICVTSAEPATETAAYTTVMLARTTTTSGSFTNADDSSGRKVTIVAFSGLAITNGGTATHVAIVRHADNTLRYITTCASLYLTTGGTVDIPSWKINIQDPT